MDDEREQDAESGAGGLPIDAVPGLARITVGAWYRGATWGVGTALKATERLSRAAVSGDSAAELIDEIREETLENLQRVLGVVGRETPAEPLADAVSSAVPDGAAGAGPNDRERVESLRERGAELLDRAAEVDPDSGQVHPGFDRIIDQLAPDEARILKLLINEGEQPIVYVNKTAPLGLGARVVARRLSLIGREAGCMHPELVAAYLDNLVRLGLVAIRRDPVADEQAYQVVEAQPEVIEAMSSVGSGPLFRGRSSRRSIHITDFGRAFCLVCFPREHLTGELAAVDLGAEADVLPPETDPDGGGGP
jgi:hypothetical protein